MRRRTTALALACLALTGCGVSMPERGPVVEISTTGSQRDSGGVVINPRRPGAGDSPERIVRGFLDAMTATPPIQTSVAREFLTQEARADWQPTGMVIYANVSTPSHNNRVEARLVGAVRTDARGAWLGPVPDEESTIQFPMDLEDGEWRISEPPPWLVVPKSWFEQRFRQVSLYFFDPSARMLIPEPVFVPGGQQFASTLVKALLQGPSTDLTATEQTFLPSNLRSIVSVPVSDSGVAQVDLTSDTGDAPLPSPEQIDLLVSQLAWTLRQDPAIGRFRVTIDGQPVQLAGENSEFSVDHGHAYAPYVAGSSTLIFGLRDGRMVGGSPQNLETVSGPFGSGGYLLRTVSADLRADRVAGVSSNGTTLWVGPVKDTGSAPTAVITTGEDLLRPAWDYSGRLWEVDRRQGGAVVSYLRDGEMKDIHVPGISGEDVKDFLVSRDGSRILAVVRAGPGRDVILASRILTGGDGQVTRADAADDVTPAGDADVVFRDIVWRSPTSIVVLRPVTRQLFLARGASVDGGSSLDPLLVPVDGDVTGLAGTPVPGESIYAVADGTLVDLTDPQSSAVPIDEGVTSLGYVG